MLRFISKPSINQPFIFDIDGRTLEYGREDFCLITSFRFSKVNLDPDEEDHSEFHMRVFSKIKNLKGEHLLELVNKDVKFAKLDDEDATEVCHDVYVHTEVSKVHSKEEEMIIDLQVRLNSVEEKLKPGPSDVDHLDKTGDLSKNAHDCGLDRQSMRGVSQCMNVDESYKNWNDVSNNYHADGLDHKSVEGVSQCTGLKDEYKSVTVDGLISLRSQDVGHLSKKSFVVDSPQFKVMDNEEACHSNFCLSTQQVRELINDFFHTPSIQVQDACVSELIDFVKDDVNVNSVVKEEAVKDDVNVNSLVKEDIEKDDVHVDSFMKEDIEKDDVQFDSVVKDAEQIENKTLPRQKFPGKATYALISNRRHLK
nr:phospholipase-like protein [Tanacetum cinerariifolium]